jgi:hypothetical protein
VVGGVPPPYDGKFYDVVGGVPPPYDGKFLG